MALRHTAFSVEGSTYTSVVFAAFIFASASSFSFFAMSHTYLVDSAIASTRLLRMSAGKASQNFLLTITAYMTTPWSDSDMCFCTSCIFCVYLFEGDRKSTRLNSSHGYISYAVFCLKK